MLCYETRKNFALFHLNESYNGFNFFRYLLRKSIGKKWNLKYEKSWKLKYQEADLGFSC